MLYSNIRGASTPFSARTASSITSVPGAWNVLSISPEPDAELKFQEWIPLRISPGVVADVIMNKNVVLYI